LSRGRISNASGTVYGIKLKLSACVEGDVEEKQSFYVHSGSIATTTSATTIATMQAKGIKLKLSRKV
jgi:hypothetical protein